jgi:hypothetical protein
MNNSVRYYIDSQCDTDRAAWCKLVISGQNQGSLMLYISDPLFQTSTHCSTGFKLGYPITEIRPVGRPICVQNDFQLWIWAHYIETRIAPTLWWVEECFKLWVCPFCTIQKLKARYLLIDGTMILKRILKKCDGRMWNTLMTIRIP